MGKIKKVWKDGGVEDKFILKLIKQGKVHKNTKPKQLVELNPEIFRDFSDNVVRNHLNSLKRQNGLYRK